MDHIKGVFRDQGELSASLLQQYMSTNSYPLMLKDPLMVSLDSVKVLVMHYDMNVAMKKEI